MIKLNSYSNANEAMDYMNDDRSHGDDLLADCACRAWKEIFPTDKYGEAPNAEATMFHEQFINLVNLLYDKWGFII